MKQNKSWIPSALVTAALEAASEKHSTDSFGRWLERTTPYWTWDWAHLIFIRQHLYKITAGEVDKLMLFVPPRHGKSEMVTVRYPIYRLLRNPSQKVIIGAYNQTLANKFSRKARRIANQTGVKLSKDRTAVDDWETAKGGGVRSVGVGAGITGQGGDLIIIDDPVKNREESRSPTYRERVFEWYRDDLYTRREPGASIILIMTRWHEDDLAGRILNSEDGDNWKVVSLPALAEADDPLGRRPGYALCPERYDAKTLRKIKKVLGRSFYALYQQRPQEQEGDIFKRSWFTVVDEMPREAQRVRYWDLAATAGGGDYTVGTLMARTEQGEYYVEDVIRGRWSTGQRNKKIKEAAEKDALKYGGTVRTWIEQEPGSSGVDAVTAIIRMLAGYPAKAEKVTGDKVVRAEPLADQCEIGNVMVKKAKWNDEWLDELTSFDNGAHDDQVDSASGAFNKLAVPIWLL